MRKGKYAKKQQYYARKYTAAGKYPGHQETLSKISTQTWTVFAFCTITIGRASLILRDSLMLPMERLTRGATELMNGGSESSE